MSSAQAVESSIQSPPTEHHSRRGIARAASIIGLGNIASRILGLVRESVIAQQFGTGNLVAAFTFASQVPTTIYDLLVGGLLSSALVPVFSEYATRDDDNASLWRLASLILSLAAVVLTTITILVLLFAPQITLLLVGFSSNEFRAATALLIRLIAPSILFFGLSGVITGLLYALKRFTFVAFGAAIFNMGIIIGALFLSRAFEGNVQIMGLALGLFLGSVLQFSLLLPDLRHTRLRFTLGAFWRDPGLRRILALYIPIALSVIVSTVGVFIDRTLVSLTGIEQIAMWMRYATTLIQFPLGLVAAAISLAVLPSLARLAALDDLEGFRGTLQVGVRLVLVLIVPATVGLYLLGEPIVRLLFERGKFVPGDTYWTTLALHLYLLGLIFAAIDQLLIIAFYSRQDTWTPALVGIAAVGVYLVVALPLVLLLEGEQQMTGLVLANSAQHVSHALIMLVLLQRRLGGLSGSGMRTLLPRILLAAVGMALAVWATLSLLTFPDHLLGRILTVAIPALVGLGSYILFVMLLRIEEARELGGLFLRRFVPRRPG